MRFQNYFEYNGERFIMSNKEETIKALQQIVTGLAGNSFQHRIQSKIFASQGFTKLGEKGNYIKTIWGMGYKFEVEA